MTEEMRGGREKEETIGVPTARVHLHAHLIYTLRFHS